MQSCAPLRKAVTEKLRVAGHLPLFRFPLGGFGGLPFVGEEGAQRQHLAHAAHQHHQRLAQRPPRHHLVELLRQVAPDGFTDAILTLKNKPRDIVLTTVSKLVFYAQSAITVISGRLATVTKVILMSVYARQRLRLN